MKKIKKTRRQSKEYLVNPRKTSIYLPSESWAQIKELAVNRHISAGYMLNDIIDAYLGRKNIQEELMG